MAPPARHFPLNSGMRLSGAREKGYAAPVHSPWRTFFIAALATTAVLAAFGASSALAAPKEIAYVCKGEDICLLDPDNPAAVTNLTDNEGTSLDEKPIWSPDGKKIAFISNFGVGGNTKNLFVMEPEAPGQAINLAVQVTHFPNGEQLGEAVWSPDGSRIAFVVGNSESNDKVEAANSNGTTATPVIVAVHGVHPSWAPDSGKIAYSYEGQVYIENADGSGSPAPLAGGNGDEPVWSPDGSKIAYGREFTNIQIIGASGGTPLTITNSSQFAFASWSPSGAQLAYHEQEGENSYFQIVNADGSGKHHLPIVQDLNANGPAPSWSPDGTRLVFQGRNFSEPLHATNEVYIANTDGSGSVTALTGDQGFSTYPSWRPSPAAAPQVFTPAGGATKPLPATQKPKTVWITKRIFWTEGPDLTVIVLSVGCSAPACNVGGQGTAKGAAAAGIRPRPDLAVTSVKSKKNPKQVVVGRIVKTTIHRGQTRPVKIKLTPAGVKLLTQLGKLAIDIRLTIASPGQPTVVEHHKVNVFVQKAKKQHKRG